MTPERVLAGLAGPGAEVIRLIAMQPLHGSLQVTARAPLIPVPRPDICPTCGARR